MTELEKVEKLRERADVSFAEAKEALDNANGDVLEALILLEKNGRATIPAGGGFFSGAGTPGPHQEEQNQYQYHARSDNGNNTYRGESFSSIMRRFGRFCLKMFEKGNNNFLEATSKGGEHMFSCPVTILVLLLLCFFWVTVPLLVLSLFLGFRYQFRGADLGKEPINSVMDNASNVVEDVKRSFQDGRSNGNGNYDSNYDANYKAGCDANCDCNGENVE